jgi:hypothetical protein
MRSVTAADPKARADIEDNFRKTIGQLLGGAAVLIGAALAYMQFTQQQQTAQRQFREQQQASRDLLISNQVAKGFEQLGSDKAVVRLGGIYALEGVMYNSDQYYGPVLEALCAFVRDGTRTDTGEGPPTTDIQAVLTVIARRPEPPTVNIQIEVIESRFPITVEMGIPDFTKAHIPKANLIDANLNLAYLNGATLTGADLVHADLKSAELKSAALTDANLISADLTGADLTGANLTGAYVGATLTRADLTRADLTRADLTGADLTGARLDGADLTGAKVTQAQLDRACGTAVTLDAGLALKPCPK